MGAGVGAPHLHWEFQAGDGAARTEDWSYFLSGRCGDLGVLIFWDIAWQVGVWVAEGLRRVQMAGTGGLQLTRPHPSEEAGIPHVRILAEVYV